MSHQLSALLSPNSPTAKRRTSDAPAMIVAGEQARWRYVEFFAANIDRRRNRVLQYRSLEEIINHPGLRIVLVKGMPSPWGQAAKTIFEIKHLDYVAAPWRPGEANEAIVAWGGESSAPIVAWAKEKPIHRWIDILYLAERLAPTPSLIPSETMQRAVMIGLSHEICGERGIGWNRRLQLFAPAYKSGNPPANIGRMGSKYGYNEDDAKAAGERIAASLKALASQLKSQYAQGLHYFVGDALSALDIYWTAFANLLDPLPREQCPMPDEWRAGFVVSDPIVKAALDPLLLEHRSQIFSEYFRDPMEL
jgi:glutathione S-transferase